MKIYHRIKLIAALTVFIAANAQAEFDVPRSVFRINELEEAKTKAAEKDKPLVFVITNPATT